MDQQELRQYRAALRREIQKSFNLTEIRTLSFDLGIDYDNLPGEELERKIIELILYLERNERLDDLIKELKRRRPDMTWEQKALLKDKEKALYVELISKTKVDLDPQIHDTKHAAKKIDMLGVSLYNFFNEIVHDSNQQMMKRLVDENVRLRVVFVNPKANYLIQRSIEDDSKHLGALLNRQNASIKNCLRFYNQLDAYYQIHKESKERPRGRIQIKLTNFCPYVSIERYDFDIYWSFYTSDTDGVHNPTFLATFEENYRVYDKLKKHFMQLMNARFHDEAQNLFLVTMGVGGPWLNRSLAEELLGEDEVRNIIDK